MARICSRCRQPVGRRPDDHDCPEDDLGPEDLDDQDGTAVTEFPMSLLAFEGP